MRIKGTIALNRKPAFRAAKIYGLEVAEVKKLKLGRTIEVKKEVGEALISDGCAAARPEMKQTKIETKEDDNG